MDNSIKELKIKIMQIKNEMYNAKSNKKYLQLKKCYHRLHKQLLLYKHYKEFNKV